MKDRTPGSNPNSNPLANNSENEGGLSFQNEIRMFMNILLVVKERWILGLSTGLLISALVVYMMLKQPEVFQSTASLYIDSESERVVDIETVVDTEARSETELRNHEQQMRTRRFADYALKALDERETQKIVAPYADEAGNTPSVKQVFQQNRGINREGQMFYLTFKHRDPEVAAMMANLSAERYITFMLDRTGLSNDSALRFLKDQANELRDRVEQGESALQKYRKEHNMVSLEESQNLVVDRLKTLSAAVTTAEVERMNIASEVSQVEDNEDDVAALLAIPAITDFVALAPLQTELENARSKKAELSLRYLRRHPKMVEITTRIEKLEESLAKNVARAVRELNNRLDDAERRVEKLRAELKKAEDDALRLDQMAIDYNVLRRQLETDRQSHAQILSRLNETTISSQLSNSSIRLLDEALPSYVPIQPNPKKIAMMGGLLFFLGFIGLPLLIEIFDNRLKSSQDIESFIHKPTLGDIPDVHMSIEKPATAVLDGEQEGVVEMFRSVFGGINLLVNREPPTVYLITSSVPAEGKSFFSANFAAINAKHGKRTLLIDCDFRRPTLHRSFELSNHHGTLRYLEDQSVELAEAPLEDKNLQIVNLGENLFLLRSGGSSRKGTELVGSERFTRMVSYLKSHFDVIILDSPPSLIFPDALFLADNADYVVYISRHNKVSRHKVKHLVNRLDDTHAEVLGIVLNGRTSSRGIRYGYEYNKSYGYNYYHYRHYKSYSDYYREEDGAQPQTGKPAKPSSKDAKSKTRV